MSEPFPERVRAARRRLLGERRVMVIVGDPTPAAEVAPLIRRLLAAGADLLELRLKRTDRETRTAVSRAAALDCARAGALLLINDHPALSRETGADGAHIGQADETPTGARRLLGVSGLLGLSVHGAGEARSALRDRAVLDYAGVGTVFRSVTKPGLSPCGLSGLRRTIEHLDGLWAYAIGGIDAARAAACVRAGAHGVAVGAAITGAADPACALRAFHTAIERALTGPRETEGAALAAPVLVAGRTAAGGRR